ncbi:bacteriochlorophyll 4-vinyl reductase [Hoeflea sp.]|uniref:bacteriochlorophyll 4-vinyl reductase n=1 Tax=Hoeflea sp. TaxID=1940281 RepID=UPI003B51B0E0
MSGSAVAVDGISLVSSTNHVAIPADPGRGLAPNTVGPNAVIQTRLALADACGDHDARRLFGYAELESWFDRPPDRMVEAEMVHRLNMALLAGLGGEAFDIVMTDAGRRTGHYILENRIPRAARIVLPWLPARLASRILLRAIVANSWTFAGNATVCARGGSPATVEISGNPLPMPGCAWHRAVFETLFSTLLGKAVRAEHCDTGPDTRHDIFSLRWNY